MNTAQPLSGKVAIITGSARNMGRAFAQALARLGADITVHHHGPASQSDAEETARLVREQGSRAVVISGDLADLSTVKQLFDETINAFGQQARSGCKSIGKPEPRSSSGTNAE